MSLVLSSEFVVSSPSSSFGSFFPSSHSTRPRCRHIAAVGWSSMRSWCFRSRQSCRSCRRSWGVERRWSSAERPVCKRKIIWRSRSCGPARSVCVKVLNIFTHVCLSIIGIWKVFFIFNFSGSESEPAACVCAVGVCGGEPAEQQQYKADYISHHRGTGEGERKPSNKERRSGGTADRKRRTYFDGQKQRKHIWRFKIIWWIWSIDFKGFGT